MRVILTIFNHRDSVGSDPSEWGENQKTLSSIASQSRAVGIHLGLLSCQRMQSVCSSKTLINKLQKKNGRN